MSNMNVTRRALAAAAIALSLAATAALAQQPGRIRGQIEKVDGDMLVLKTRDGAMLNVKLDEKARVSALVKATLADIKTDSFIGIAVAGLEREHITVDLFDLAADAPRLLRESGGGRQAQRDGRGAERAARHSQIRHDLLPSCGRRHCARPSSG